MAERPLPASPERSPISRRAFLRGAAAAAVVVGFDPVRRSWATKADDPAALADDFPDFDGELLLDEASLAAAADDFGHMVSRRPRAVLRPGSVDDVVALVHFARRHGIGVAARGQGHGTAGQAQVEAGVVIDTATLATVHEVSPAGAVVDAGATWLEVLEATLPHGLAPPVLVDFLELRVGGTLSVGGVGSQSFRAGAQVDHVLELWVVTGRGELVACSPHHRRRLFLAALGGLGQFAILVRARLRLVEAAPRTRLYHALYDELSTFLEDQRTLVEDGRFDTVQGFALPDGDGWIYQLEATKDFAPGDEPDDAALTAGLAFRPGSLETQDLDYVAYLDRLAPIVAFLREIGVWDFPHPWINLFLPGDEAEAVVAETLAGITSADVGEGPVLIYVARREVFRRPLLRLPEDETVVLFALLRNAIPPTPERAAELLEQNRELFARATAAGGFAYPIGELPRKTSEWRRHYGRLWPAFLRAKRHYDPARVLTPGRGIFPPPRPDRRPES